MPDSPPEVTPDYGLVLWAMQFFSVHEKAGSEIAIYIATQRAANVPLYKLNFDRWQRLNPWQRRTAAYRRFTQTKVSDGLPIEWVDLIRATASISYDDAAECFQIFIEEVAKSLAEKKNTDIGAILKLNVQAREPARQTEVTGNVFGSGGGGTGSATRKPWRVKANVYKGTRDAIN